MARTTDSSISHSFDYGPEKTSPILSGFHDPTSTVQTSVYVTHGHVSITSAVSQTIHQSQGPLKKLSTISLY